MAQCVTRWESDEESEDHECDMHGHETWITRCGRIGILNVYGPIRGGSWKVPHKNFRFVDFCERLAMVMHMHAVTRIERAGEGEGGQGEGKEEGPGERGAARQPGREHDEWKRMARWDTRRGCLYLMPS